MKSTTCFLILILFLGLFLSPEISSGGDPEGWVSIFDGKSLEGWKPTEDNPDSFKVENGAIVANGATAHLFYMGPVNDHVFQNFEFKADVMAMPNSNSGIYFHCSYQKEGWPDDTGYEIQINNSHPDPQKTGSLYDFVAVLDPAAKDKEWFECHIKVVHGLVSVRIDGQYVTQYDLMGRDTHGPKLRSGTFALQAHDPGSKVLFKNLRVKPLPGVEK